MTPPPGATEGSHDSTMTALRVGAVWRVRPLAGSKLTLVPALGWRRLQLTTSPEIEGLPDASLSGFEARLDLEAPVGGFTLLAGGGYTMWTSAEELVEGGFFGSGSARAFQVEGGAAFAISRPLSLRAVVVYDATSYSGLADPASGIGTASGASDRYLGARVTVRAEW